jgi:hypothetical protein
MKGRFKRGYNIFAHDFGVFTGTVNQTNITPLIPYLVFNSSNGGINANSSNDKFIGSKEGVQNLEIIKNAISNSSLLKLSVLDHSSITNLTSYELNLPGSWSFAMSSNDTLSCNLIAENFTSVYALLRFKDGVF